MDETMVQNCIFCGEVISDYRNAMYPYGQEPPKGWATGNVFISGSNPKWYTNEVKEGEEFIDCKDIK